MLQGLMFLPDGRVLIMDSELYKQTIEKSIVLDLFEGTSLSLMQSSSLSTSSQEEEKRSTPLPSSTKPCPPSTDSDQHFLPLLNSPDFSDITLLVDGHSIHSH